MVDTTFYEQLRAFEQMHPLTSASSELKNGLDTWLDEVQTRLTRLGFTSQLIPPSSKISHPTVLFYSEYAAEAPHSLLLYNSLPTLTQARWEIFPIFARLRALELVRSLLGKLPLTLKWLIQVAPDPGAETLSSLLQTQPERLEAHACLWDDSIGTYEAGWGGDGVPLLMLGCKGRLGVELRTQTQADHQLFTMHGAVAPNALWRLIWALQRVKDERENILIEGFYDQLEGPADASLAAISALPDDALQLAQRWSLPALPLGLQGLQLHYTQMLVPTCSLTLLDGHDKHIPLQLAGEQIPRKACARLDFHLVPGQKPEQIFNLLRQHLDAQGFGDIEMRWLYGYQPGKLQAHEALLHLVQEATHIAYATPPHVLPMTMSSQPLALLPKYMPTIITSLGSLDINDDTMVTQIFASASRQTALCIVSLAQQCL